MLCERLRSSDLLNEANHRFITMLIESFIVMVFNHLEIRKVLFVRRLVSDFPIHLFKINNPIILAFFDCVLEIGHEPLIF